MTLEEMASAIRSNVGTGLKETGNYVYSIDQIKDEISNTRSSMILQLSQQGTINPSYFAQKRENLELKAGIFPEEGLIESNNPVFITRIPKLAMTRNNSSVLYLGPMDMSLNIHTYFTLTDLQSHRYTRVIKNRPYSFIDLAQDINGDVPVYMTNLGPAPFKYITVRAIFDDPVRILQEDGYYIDDEEFPAPLAIQEAIIDQISKKYVDYYKAMTRANEQNDQTDKT